MPPAPSRIARGVSLEEFDALRTGRTIIVGAHAYDALSEGQRKIIKEGELISIVQRETPRGIGIQHNGRYSVYYARKWGFVRIIVQVYRETVEIVTFTNEATMPNLARMNHD